MDTITMRQVGEYILAEPRRFNMLAVWVESVGQNGNISESLQHAKNAIPPCGTVACFAGEWAIMKGVIDPTRLGRYIPSVSHNCKTALKLPNDKLFFENSWPERLRTSMKAGTRRYAEHFVKVVLEDYIATNGWEND